STRLSMLLAPLRPAPDLVSLVTFMLGLVGAVLLAAGQGLAGGVLVHVSSVADGVDGALARLQLRGGPRGALLGGVLDRVGGGGGPGGTGRGPGRGHRHLGAVARPPGRLPPPPAGSRRPRVELAGLGGRCLRGCA